MIRSGVAGVLAIAMIANAPLQCGHGSDANLRHEDDAGDALWALAMDFRAKGNEQAARQTLEFLVARYPSNRHVPSAREDLAGASGASGGGAGDAGR